MRKNSKLLVSVVSAGIFLFTASMETDADTQNLLRKATIYTADGAEKLIRSYEYDDNGNKTELHFWAMGQMVPDGHIQRTSMIYLESGQDAVSAMTIRSFLAPVCMNTAKTEI